MDTRSLLEQVKSGEMDIDTAQEQLKKLPYEEMGFAKLDHHRALRSGFGEVVYCSGKETTHLVEIFKRFYEHGTDVLGTRATYEQYQAVKKEIDIVEYDAISKVLRIVTKEVERSGLVVICTGGTSDIAVAEEAAQTAEFFGSNVERIYDVGVAGIHRLISKVENIRKANCVVAVAGMEGALAGVVAGLVDKPVIAVPTSIGYGASFGGVSALLTMLNSCAEGVSVVNIDNGFGAGYLSTQINRLAGER